jgi:antitoxin ParD1/3/4
MSSTESSIPEALRAFVEEQVASRGFASSGEYVAELIRRDRDVQRLRGLLLEGAASGDGEPLDFEAQRRRIRNRASAR